MTCVAVKSCLCTAVNETDGTKAAASFASSQEMRRPVGHSFDVAAFPRYKAADHPTRRSQTVAWRKSWLAIDRFDHLNLGFTNDSSGFSWLDTRSSDQRPGRCRPCNGRSAR